METCDLLARFYMGENLERIRGLGWMLNVDSRGYHFSKRTTDYLAPMEELGIMSPEIRGSKGVPLVEVTFEESGLMTAHLYYELGL
jgi:hypothetical protein